MDSDFGELSALWRNAGDPGEAKALGLLSDRAIARAQLEEKIELAIAFALALAVIFGIWRNGALQTIVFGLLIIGTLMWSSRSRYRLRRIEWRRDHQDRETIIRDAIARSAARVHRAALSLILLIPAALLGLLFGRGGVSGDLLGPAGIAAPTRVMAAGALGIATILGFLAVAIVRDRRQLSRLRGILEEYHRETAAVDLEAAELRE